MRTTKLLAILGLLYFQIGGELWSQCSFITVNGSAQDPKSVCAPVDFTMDAKFEFMVPVDTTLVEVLFRWNDGTGAETVVPGNWNADSDSIWASASHIYLPTDECSRTAEAILIYDGELCLSSGYQSQIFSTWGTDEENSGELMIDPVVHYVCEGEDVIDLTFDDASTFNCNINIEPDRPNRYYRWVQFIYNTYSQGGDRIPNVTVRDGSSVVHNMTDATGNFVADLDGPIVRIPIPADGPNQTSYEITAPAGGIAGDIFEITMRNWNVCNPYDETPTDGNPPADIVNGDNPPIETTARIEIVAPTPVTVPPLFEFCTGDNINLVATAGSAEVRWYKDAGLDTLLYVGNNFHPAQPPYNLDNDVAGSHRFHITSFEGFCESAPQSVDLILHQTPVDAYAGPDMIVCYDTITLQGSTPSVGVGAWSTSGTALISDTGDPNPFVNNLEFGHNTFTWTIANGSCVTSDVVRITSDRQPDAANAGSDQVICDVDPIVLSATPVNRGGSGLWNILTGFGSLSDPGSSTSNLSGLLHGDNQLSWRVSSRYGACPITIDTVTIIADFSPGIPNAGPDYIMCETSSEVLSGSLPVNDGAGYWSVALGTGVLSDSGQFNSTISNLSYGTNELVWHFDSKLGICPSTTDTVRYTRFQSPGVADAGFDKAFCLVTQDTLQGNAPVVGTGIWNVIENPSGIAPTFTPNGNTPDALFSVAPGNEGKYVLEWELVNGTCISSDTVSIDFGIPVPQALAGSDTVTCGYDYMLQGNSISIGQGTWSKVAGLGNVTFTPNNHDENAVATFLPGYEGIYEFEWRFESGTCPPTMDTVQVEITEAPLAPALPNLEACGPSSFAITVPTVNPRQVAFWYSSPTASSYFYRGIDFNTGLLTTDVDYYVSLYDTISTCESPRTHFSIQVHEVPNVPSLSGDTLCGAGTANISGTYSHPATQLYWFTNSISASVADSGNFLSIDTVSTNQHFYARSIDLNTGCESGIDSVAVIIWPEIAPPVTYPDSSCGTSSYTLHADKSEVTNTLFWYNADTNLVNIGDSTPTAMIESSTYFLVAGYNPVTHCMSDYSRLDIKINEVPDLPQIGDTASCGAATFTLEPEPLTNATTFRWYEDPVTTTIHYQGIALSTPLLNATESYYVAGYNEVTRCEGIREEVEVSIYPSPGAIDILGPTLVLLDQSDVVLFTIYGQPGSYYTWDIPSEITVLSNMNDFVRLEFPNEGTFTISVFETTADGCVGSPVYHSITVIEDQIAIDLGDDRQIACTDQPFEIKPWLYGGTPPYIYSWTGDTNYITSTSTLFTTFNPPGTGEYMLYLEVVDVNLKKAYDSVLITVYASPTTEITNIDTIACVGENFQLTTNTVGAEPFYHIWTGPTYDLSNYAIAGPVYTPRDADTVTFYYYMTDANGCSAWDSVMLVSDQPVADFDILTGPGCSPLTVEFQNTSKFANSYQWSFEDGHATNGTHPQHTFENSTPEIKYFEANLTAISSLGCSDTKTDYVMVWPNPTADITALPQNSCNPAQVLLVSTPGNSLYHWNFGDGANDTASNKFNVIHQYVTDGLEDQTFRASVITQSSLNCFDTAYTDITVYATPVADFEVSPEESVYPNNVFDLDNNTQGNWNYRWDFGNGDSSQEVEPGGAIYDEAGYYTINLTASGEHCADSISKNIRLEPAAPVAMFKGADNGCMPHTVTLVNSSEYAESFLWEFGDGSISTAKDPSYTYYESGIYKIKLTVTGQGGVSTFSDTSRVYILPNSYFDIAPRYVYVNDEPVNYFNLSDNGDVFEWDFGDGTTSDELNPKHIYKEAGTYDVTLKVWTENECFDLYVMENAVLAEPSGLVEFPNAFRPDSPLEENRVFMPGIIDHVDDYHLMIFNRWGELIFESHNQEVGWDGYYNGELAKQDVYIWKVKGTYSDGQGFVKTGNVTLLY